MPGSGLWAVSGHFMEWGLVVAVAALPKKMLGRGESTLLVVGSWVGGRGERDRHV